VLIPTALRLRRAKDPAAPSRFTDLDTLLLGWGALQLVLFIPINLPGQVIFHETLTGIMRRSVMWFLDIYLVYYVVSRSSTTRTAIIESLASFCLVSSIMAALAVFETARHWLLYADFFGRWTEIIPFDVYLGRGGALRAQTSAGHSIALGDLLAAAFGMWLYLKSHVQSARLRLAGGALLWLGLLATYSRGAWMGAVAIFFAFFALGPRAVSRLLKSLGTATVVLVALMVSPLGDRVSKVLPFMGGSVDEGSITYRQILAARSWELITESPLLGDQYATFKLASLRQGEGIIDLVNTYVQVTLFYGFVGLTLFLGFMLLAMLRVRRVAQRRVASDPDLALLGTSLLATMAGTLLMIAACSFVMGVEKIYYILGGFAAGYAYLDRSEK